MYIKLGNTKINYTTPTYDDFMILAEVPDISMSYEKPILIHTKEELDIWCGTDFKERNYFDELLLSGITLFLYRPVSGEPNKWLLDYIDLDQYTIDTGKIYLSNDNQNYNDLPGTTIGNYSFYTLPSSAEDKVIYQVIDSSGKYSIEFGGIQYSKMIWMGEYETYVNIEDLSQNTGINSASLINRDTLRLTDNDGIPYCYPEYGKQYNTENYEYTTVIESSTYKEYVGGGIWNDIPGPIETPTYIVNGDLSDWEGQISNPNGGYTVRLDHYIGGDYDISKTRITGINLEGIINNYQTYVFDVDFGKTTIDPGEYIVVEAPNRKVILCNEDETTKVVVDPKYYSDKVICTRIDDLIKKLLEYGYYYRYNKEIYTNQIVSYHPCQVNYFFHLSGTTITPNFDDTQNILTELTKDQSTIEFWSKTIGTAGPDAEIGIEIEILGTDYYRATISRYDYYEIFEGYLLEVGEERLDYIISKGSKLVGCSVNNDWIVSERLKINNSEEIQGLRDGSWKMMRAWKENYTTDSYLLSVNHLADTTISFDFLMIPTIQDFSTQVIQDSYYKVYTTLLDIAVNKNCQILIGNLDTDYLFNYTGDTYNRLIYFYNDMYVGNGYYRPPYYVFLKGLLLDTYSATTDLILYNSPLDGIGVDPYNDTPGLVESLELHKSNYLIDNGQEYYYRCYQWGTKPVSSGLMRFVLSKISRELEKNKWKYLGEKMTGKIQSKIQDVIDKVKTNFTIIRSISIIYFNLDYYNNKINLTLDTEISDLVKNNMRLDITLNFNKELWQQQ